MMNISKLKPSNYSFWFKLLVMLVLIALPLFIRDGIIFTVLQWFYCMLF